METESSVMMDLEALLRDQQKHHYQQWGILPGDLERDYLSLNRSGSAPPTVKGSRRALGSLLGGAAMGEEEEAAQPAYLSHYYSSENRNPRLPPATVSREDWRAVARRVRAGSLGGFGDQSTAAAGQPGPAAAVRQAAPVQLGRGAAGVINELGTRRRSFADVLQGDFNGSTSISGHLSCPGNHNAYDTVVDPMRVSDAQLTCHGGLDTIDVHSAETSSDLARVQSLGSSMSHPFATTHGSSLSRNATPDSQLSERSPSPHLLPIGERMDDTHNIIASNGFGAVSSCVADCGDITDAFSCLSLSKNVFANGEDYVQGLFDHELANSHELSFSTSGDQRQYLQQKVTRESKPDPFNTSTIPMLAYDQFLRRNGVITDTDSKLTPNGEFTSLKQTPSTNLYNKAVSMGSNTSASTTYYQNADLANVDFARHNLDTYSANRRLPTMLSRQLDSGGAYPSRTGNWVGSEVVMDPLYAQYLLRGAESSAFAADNLSDLSLCGSYLGASDMDLPGYQKAHLKALLAQQKLQYDKAFLSKYSGSNHGFNGHPSFGLGMPYRTSPGSILSSLSRGSPLRQSERLSCSPFTITSSMGGSMRSWNHENGIMENIIASSLLEELKNNKARSFELSDIVDHVVEFSVDQYGSRFIQQKLETTSLEEKNKIFHKILPHVRVLMIDVFGNYVIQKFFEHGTESQREQLASQLLGHVLPLSLQMYGCRVIQKALEVVDVDQQSRMVLELDGSILKCVRDQNGNHVIQKCIECVPQDRIQFIISAFYGQVVALSTHPYGCRVIQRVLEHCDDVDTQQILMDEIMESVCTLAQDQYGNYVIQHVLQHGKQEERSVIINKLSGQIVKMSQQKFASNVIEKCLTYGTPAECQHVIDEILGSTDENEPLQAMMKHQFGNYVVQKLLETCDDQNRELILSRIKVHLDTLKRYTYGKHIVARVEKLIATGERCSGISSYS